MPPLWRSSRADRRIRPYIDAIDDPSPIDGPAASRRPAVTRRVPAARAIVFNAAVAAMVPSRRRRRAIVGDDGVGAQHLPPLIAPAPIMRHVRSIELGAIDGCKCCAPTMPRRPQRHRRPHRVRRPSSCPAPIVVSGAPAARATIPSCPTTHVGAQHLHLVIDSHPIDGSTSSSAPAPIDTRKCCAPTSSPTSPTSRRRRHRRRHRRSAPDVIVVPRRHRRHAVASRRRRRYHRRSMPRRRRAASPAPSPPSPLSHRNGRGGGRARVGLLRPLPTERADRRLVLTW